MKIKPVMLCAHGGYEASFEACFVDLGCLEKHNLSTALLENSIGFAHGDVAMVG